MLIRKYGTLYSGGTGGGAGNTYNQTGGGAGNPGGIGYYSAVVNTKNYGQNGTEGLLIIYSDSIINKGVISSQGSKGGEEGVQRRMLRWRFYKYFL